MDQAIGAIFNNRVMIHRPVSFFWKNQAKIATYIYHIIFCQENETAVVG